MQIHRILENALRSLYSHYADEDEEWKRAGIKVPPVFIVVCNNTATSKLVYEWIAGWEREIDGEKRFIHNGHLELFRNYDNNGNPLPRMNTLLIDSQQIDSGEALDPNFRAAAEVEIDRFRREKAEREGAEAGNLSDADLLREVMNTVGREGRLGEQIRCVVSVSMLTEGWDANTVTHVLGVRAFGTQLLCEQVIGRGLRRQSYEFGEETDPAGTRLVRDRIRRHSRHPLRFRRRAAEGHQADAEACHPCSGDARPGDVVHALPPRRRVSDRTPRRPIDGDFLRGLEVQADTGDRWPMYDPA